LRQALARGDTDFYTSNLKLLSIARKMYLIFLCKCFIGCGEQAEHWLLTKLRLPY